MASAEWGYHAVLVLAKYRPLVEPELNASWSTEYLHLGSPRVVLKKF